MLAPDMFYHRGCIKCSECSRQPDNETPIMMAPRSVSQALVSISSHLTFHFTRNNDDVFAPEILEPYCKFCYAKKFKMSAIALQDILEIAPQTAYCI